MYKKWRRVATFGKEVKMSEDLVKKTDIDIIFSDISSMIFNAKNQVMRQMNHPCGTVPD